jgi:hypothetical protein
MKPLRLASLADQVNVMAQTTATRLTAAQQQQQQQQRQHRNI